MATKNVQLIDPNELKAKWYTPESFVKSSLKQGKTFDVEKIRTIAQGEHLGIYRDKKGRWWDMRLTHIHTHSFARRQNVSGKVDRELVIAPSHIPIKGIRY